MQIFVDVSDTLRSGLHTGVQRVVVETARRMRSWPACQLVRFDGARGVYRPLTLTEESRLFGTATGGPGPRTLATRLEQWGFFRPLALVLDVYRRFFFHGQTRFAEGWEDSVFFTAEVVGDRARVRKIRNWLKNPGFRLVLVVHDLIPLTHPRLSLMDQTDFRRYLSLVSKAVLLLPVSDTTAGVVQDYFRNTVGPRSVRLYPGAEPNRPPTDRGQEFLALIKPMLACVGSIEPRKNQGPLLEILESLWEDGLRFSFVFVGRPSPLAGNFALRFQTLVARGRPLLWLNPATEVQLEALYQTSLATVYLSEVEGFGLPVLESLTRGTPCLTSDCGAVGEVARWFGGCLTVDAKKPEAWAGAIRSLVNDPFLVQTLKSTFRTDRLVTWDEYANKIHNLLEEWVGERP